MITSIARPLLLTVALAAAAALQHDALAAPAADTVVLTPHRAVYDLKLARTRGSRAVEAVRGRILYDFSGSACEGYALQFRQVSELDSGQGKAELSDLRANTWEDGQARKFRFNSENVLDEKRTDKVDGQAERKAKALSVSLSKPKDKSFVLPVDAVFPTEHMRRIIIAARAGQNVLEFPVYDGSDTGEKLYNTLTVIGRPLDKPPADAAGQTPALANMPRWPVTVSYFEQQDEKAQHTGEQTPVYSISFELYENGVSRALSLDYADFSITGTMSSLDIKTAKPCP